MIAQDKMRMDFAEHDVIAGEGEIARDVRVAGAQALSLGKENGTSQGAGAARPPPRGNDANIRQAPPPGLRRRFSPRANLTWNNFAAASASNVSSPARYRPFLRVLAICSDTYSTQLQRQGTQALCGKPQAQYRLLDTMISGQ